jgi:large subunit ribosomal protein L3
MSTSKHYPEGLLGKKLGMTQVFTPEGASIPVTIIQAGPCYVLDVRGQESHGYNAVQFGFEPKKAQRCSKAEAGQFKKAAQGSFYHVKEVRCDVQSLGWGEVGKEIMVGDVFKDGEVVDVSGVSIGRGFQDRFDAGWKEMSNAESTKWMIIIFLALLACATLLMNS